MIDGLKIQSRSHEYAVSFVETLEQAVLKSQDGSKIFYLIDQNIIRLYEGDLAAAFESGRIVSFHATEENKSYDRLSPIFCKLIEMGFKRDSKLVVVGGGITQDVGCFISTVLGRGIKWDLIPTTLLAQCDSCIGSKSSINIGAFKNQIGTFYPPFQITVPNLVLKTLTKDDIRSGVGEIVKIAMIAGPEEWTRRKSQLAQLDSDFSMMKTLVSESLMIKKSFIEADEFDRGIRNLLNYGHTFGHAYESVSHYEIPHGIAVLIGVVTANFVSEKMGIVQRGAYQDVRNYCEPYFSPFEKKLKDYDVDKILAAMKTDKKNTGDNINCILTRGFGKMEKVPLNLKSDLQPALAEFLRII